MSTQPLTDTQKSALRDLLEDVTISIHPDNKSVSVDFKSSVLGNAPAERRVNVNPRPGEKLGVDLTKAQEKDVILFILAHEIMHTIHSDLRAKQRFTEEYPAFPQTAGRLRNLTEDLYVNREATEEKPGVRVGYAIYSECFMQGYDPITEYPDAVAYVKATEQIGIGGTVRGLKDADADLKEFVARADALLDMCEHEDDADRRDELTHDLIDLLQEYITLETTAPPELPPLIGTGGDETRDMPDTGNPQPAPQQPDDADSNSDDGNAAADATPDTEGDSSNEDADPAEDTDGSEPDDEPRQSPTQSGDEADTDADTDAEADAPAQPQQGDDQQDDGQQGDGMDADTTPDTPGDGETTDGANSGGNGNDTAPECPQCGDTPDNEAQTVDGLIAARANPPFDVNASWVGDVTFVTNEEVCGFRVDTRGDVPTDTIESTGYKVASVSRGVEILEPLNNYDETEEITGYACPSCGYEWVPTIGGDH